MDEEVFEDNEAEGSNEKEEAHQVQGEESSLPGPAAKAKVVRRLSFSSSSGEKTRMYWQHTLNDSLVYMSHVKDIAYIKISP